MCDYHDWMIITTAPSCTALSKGVTTLNVMRNISLMLYLLQLKYPKYHTWMKGTLDKRSGERKWNPKTGIGEKYMFNYIRK